MLHSCCVSGLCICYLQYLNELLDTAGVPLEIVDGYIGSISVTVPWSSLITDNTVIEINDLELTVAPKHRADNGGTSIHLIY